MIVSARCNVNPALLRWARERANLGIGDIATTAALKKYRLWEEGKESPTISQVEIFAKKTHVAVGKLFLSKPPKEQMPIPDFRPVNNSQDKRFSVELYDTVNMCLSRQDWYLEYLAETGKKQLGFVGAADTNSDPIRVAGQIRQSLGFDLDNRARSRTWEEALRIFVDATENIGSMVMISGVVGNNTSRKLSVKDFSGFALVDKFAPLIFINGTASKAEQIYALAHELAHIWSNKTGISNYSVDESADHTQEERWCNKVAAEILAPAQKLLDKSDDLGATRIVGKAKPSERSGTEEQEEEGNFYYTLRNRLGNRFSKALIESTLNHKVLHRDAMWLIGVNKLSTFDNFAKKLCRDEGLCARH